MKNTSKGASKELVKIIKEQFGKNNTVKFMISERGNQRIEISDGKTTWQTLEATSKAEDDNDFDDISVAIMGAIYEQIKR